MSRRTHLIFASVIFLGLILWWFSEHDASTVVPEIDATAAANDQPQDQKITDAEIQRQFEAMERDKQAYSAELSRREADQNRRLQAGAKTVEYRQELQLSRSAAWSRIITANWAEYRRLHALAAADPHGMTPCTICNGRGSMDLCVLCQNSGKCPTCHGTGQLSDGELCPTCLGSGKCYLCNGSGKMICPFCDDGIIYITLPPPSRTLPIRR